MIANCRRCGKMFAKTFKDICPDCVRDRQTTFNRIREYLKSNPASTVPDVVEALDVLVEDVIELIEEGSLMLRDLPNFSLQCERCETPTQEGRYCAKCKGELATQLANATSLMRNQTEKEKQSRFYSQH